MKVLSGKPLDRIKRTKLQHQTDSQAKRFIFRWTVKVKFTYTSESESFTHPNQKKQQILLDDQNHNADLLQGSLKSES